LPERTPDALLADKGYDADAIRADLADRNIQAVIPGRSNRARKSNMTAPSTDRSIATRYDQLAASYLSMVHIATARYRLRFVHAA
jgi:transposase